MIVSDEARLLFVHVQKTGGVSTERHLRAALPDAQSIKGTYRHATYAEILAKHPEYGDYWSFAFVRNPWSRLWSWWRMIQRQKGSIERGKEEAAERVEKNKFWSDVVESIETFEQFVLEGPDRHERLRTPQVAYLSAPGREIDFIGRTESFEDDLTRIFAERGLPPFEKVEHVNKGLLRKADYTDQYDEAMKQKVVEIFGPDIDRFGYQF
jgi:hypothetical protein